MPRDQHRRQRMIGVSASNYFTGTALLVVYALMDVVDWWVPLLHAAFAGAGSVAFIAAVRSGLNLRSREPNLFAWQMGFALVVVFTFLALVPQLSFLLLSSLFVTAVFGLVQFSVRQFLGWAGIALLGVALVFAWRRPQLALPADGPAQLAMLWLCLLCALARFVAVASHVGALRGKLNEKNGLLSQSLLRIRDLADGLERRVAERTAELREANDALRAEVAERQRTEVSLRHAQDELVKQGRLALLGEMSAVITHEVRQPLTALRVMADNGRRQLAINRLDDVRRNLDGIADLADRMARITQQLKTVAHAAPAVPGSADVGAAVAATLDLLRPRLEAEGVHVVLDLAPQALVAADRHRLEQVLLNLVGNALDAMDGRPARRLDIHARPDSEASDVGEASKGIEVSVSDTGPGLPTEVLERLFEPFFSTKPPGQGLGLGLVICNRILGEFGSTLRAANHGGGAVFSFRLPAAAVVR